VRGLSGNSLSQLEKFGSSETYSYDALGRLTTVISGAGQRRNATDRRDVWRHRTVGVMIPRLVWTPELKMSLNDPFWMPMLIVISGPLKMSRFRAGGSPLHFS
jgi:YD repeat-containing protein